jgi:hypothetical protein
MLEWATRWCSQPVKTSKKLASLTHNSYLEQLCTATMIQVPYRTAPQLVISNHIHFLLNEVEASLLAALGTSYSSFSCSILGLATSKKPFLTAAQKC